MSTTATTGKTTLMRTTNFTGQLPTVADSAIAESIKPLYVILGGVLGVTAVVVLSIRIVVAVIVSISRQKQKSSIAPHNDVEFASARDSVNRERASPNYDQVPGAQKIAVCQEYGDFSGAMGNAGYNALVLGPAEGDEGAKQDRYADASILLASGDAAVAASDNDPARGTQYQQF